MKPLLRALALGVGPLVVVAGLGTAGKLAVIPPLALTPLARPCSQPPVFKPGYQRGENFVVPQGAGFKFRAESWLEADLCSAGTLKISADGELAGDEEPQLTVALNGAVLASPGFAQGRTVELAVPEAGRLLLGYLNDYYLADVRVATFRNVALTAPTCQGFKTVKVPADGGSAWNAAASAASLIKGEGLTVVPCAAGELSFLVKGREGQGAFPALTLKQGGQVLKTLTTEVDFLKVRLSVSATPVTITLTNPYGQPLADRNLNVRRIEFTPRQP